MFNKSLREQETIREQVYWKLYHLFIRPAKNLITDLRRIPESLKNLVYFYRVIYNYRPWDHSYMYDILLKILEKQRDFFSDSAKCHLSERHSKKCCKELQTAHKTLSTIRDQSYIDTDRDLLDSKYPKWTVWLPLDTDCSLHKYIYKKESDEELHDKEYKKLWSKERRLRKKTWDVFCKSFRESEGWWD